MNILERAIVSDKSKGWWSDDPFADPDFRETDSGVECPFCGGDLRAQDNGRYFCKPCGEWAE